MNLDATKKFSDRVVLIAMEARILIEDYFPIDGSLRQSQSVELIGDSHLAITGVEHADQRLATVKLP